MTTNRVDSAEVSQIITVELEYKTPSTTTEYKALVISVSTPYPDEIAPPPMEAQVFPLMSQNFFIYLPLKNSFPFADIASVELVLDESNDYCTHAIATLLSITDDNGIFKALETQFRNNKFAMAIGSTYADPGASNCVALGGTLSDRAALLFSI